MGALVFVSVLAVATAASTGNFDEVLSALVTRLDATSLAAGTPGTAQEPEVAAAKNKKPYGTATPKLREKAEVEKACRRQWTTFHPSPSPPSPSPLPTPPMPPLPFQGKAEYNTKTCWYDNATHGTCYTMSKCVKPKGSDWVVDDRGQIMVSDDRRVLHDSSTE